MEEKVIEERSSVDTFGRMRHFNSDSISKAQNRGIVGLKECAEIFTGHHSVMAVSVAVGLSGLPYIESAIFVFCELRAQNHVACIGLYRLLHPGMWVHASMPRKVCGSYLVRERLGHGSAPSLKTATLQLVTAERSRDRDATRIRN
jgi:hypothetical protein